MRRTKRHTEEKNLYSVKHGGGCAEEKRQWMVLAVCCLGADIDGMWKRKVFCVGWPGYGILNTVDRICTIGKGGGSTFGG